MYLQRNLEEIAEKLLAYYPAIVIIGPRQVGKTVFAQELRPDWDYYDLERQQDFHLITNDLGLFFEEHPRHIIIDEAQSYPALFRELRGVIDRDRQSKNRFILTGSSSPDLIKGVTESLAGRVGVLEMGTLKANERYQTPLSEFYDLFKNELQHNKVDFDSDLTNQQMRETWLKGGYPEPVLNSDPDFYQRWMLDYRQAYVERDVSSLFPRLNRPAYQRFLTTLGHLSGTIINKAEVARSIEVSKNTLSDYMDIANGTFLWRNIPYYHKNTVKSLVKRPKGYIRDNGLLHQLLHINNLDQLIALPMAGLSFESFVTEELIKGLISAGIECQYYYQRSHNGSEVDLILEGPFGTLPIEIKMSSTVQMKHLTHLHSFIDAKKLPMGMIINQSDRLTWVSRTVLQVPIKYL